MIAPSSEMLALSGIETQAEWDAAVDRLEAAAGRARDNLESALRYVEGECRTITEKQATTKQGDKA